MTYIKSRGWWYSDIWEKNAAKHACDHVDSNNLDPKVLTQQERVRCSTKMIEKGKTHQAQEDSGWAIGFGMVR